METDILLALISTEDKHHADVIRFVDRFLGDSEISPYSLIELDLLLRSGEIVVKEVTTFYDALRELFAYRQIGALPIKPEYHREAFGLRKKCGNLTYFDSIHAAVGIIENLELVSYDKEYAKVTELKYNPPNKYIR